MKDERVDVRDLGYVRTSAYFSSIGLSDDDVSRLMTNDVVLAPGLPGEDVQAYDGAFSSWASDVGKVLRASGLAVDLAVPVGSERREIVRKAAEVLLPPIIFFQQAGLAVGLNILANWLYDDFVAAFANRRVKLEVLDIETKNKRLHRVTYEGPASEVAELLKSEAKKRGE
jgi:hypothetical protein